MASNNGMSLLKKVTDRIRKIDDFLIHKKIYQVVALVFLIIVCGILIKHFNREYVYSNYEKTFSSAIHVSQGETIDYYFTAPKTRLSSIRFYKDINVSILSQDDMGRLHIIDENNEVIANKEFYLYHPTRPYISVDLGDVKLQKGERYRVLLEVTKLSPNSNMVFRMHQVNIFTRNSDDIMLDIPGGHAWVPNAKYAYDVFSIPVAIIHIIIYLAFVGILFFDRLRSKRVFAEIYRSTILLFFVLLQVELLNASRNHALQTLLPFEPRTYLILFGGFVILFVLYLLIYSIIGRGTIAIIVVGLMSLVVAYVNHSKIIMRGDPFVPWDIFSAGIAAKISSGYDFYVTKEYVASFFMIPLILILIRLVYMKPMRKIRIRIASLVIAITFTLLLSFGFILNRGLHTKFDISYPLYPPLESYQENGTMLSFFLQLNNMRPKGQESNSPELAEDITEKYEKLVLEMGLDKKVVSQDTQPNVICIMSESYTDFRSIRDIETTMDVMPYYDSILDETMNGNLQVSIFGGGTCNTEFEFLTGFSVSSLLPGSSVYTFYLNERFSSLPSLYKEYGYRTVAIHPFDPEWWDRDQAYPSLGFEEFISQDDFVEPQIVRRFISDHSAFERIIEEYEATEDGQPFFGFCVTVQNHADYSERYDNQLYDIQIESFPESDYPYAENYLSLIRESDDALRYLVEYFRTVDEPTIIVFFGDHWATMDHGFYDDLLGMDIKDVSIEDSLSLYETPYFIWANYPIPIGEMGPTSPNFLGQQVLNLSGIQSPAQRACLRVLSTKIAGMSALVIYDHDGKPYFNRQDLDEETLAVLSDYERIQYSSIFLSDDEEEGE